MALRKPVSSYRWEVHPHLGVGPIRFGMTRPDVRNLLRGKPGREMPDATPHDTFDELSLRVGYGADTGLCEFIEFWGKNGGPELEGRGFLGRPYGRARGWFEAKDKKLALSEGGLWSPAFGIELSGQGFEEDDESPIERATFFAKGRRASV
jgi:hypothetical protein